jgi:hypothetical protein
MDRYISQLIEDMRDCARNLPERPKLNLPEEMEVLRGVIEYENAEYLPIQDWFGINKEYYPDESKLNDKQIGLLVKELLQLFKAYNFIPDLPEGLPNRIIYKVLVDNMEEPVAWISEGNMYIEFCDYDPETCPYPEEYCRCKEDNYEDDYEKFENIRKEDFLNYMNRVNPNYNISQKENFGLNLNEDEEEN